MLTRTHTLTMTCIPKGMQFVLALIEMLMSGTLLKDDLVLNLIASVVCFMAVNSSEGSLIAAYILSTFIATPFYQMHSIAMTSATLAEDDDVREVTTVLKVIGVLVRTVIMANFAGQ